MALKKSKSHRKSGKIQKIIKKKAKAMKKRQKKQLKNRKKLRKDPGIPNLYPFKKDLLEKILKTKEKKSQLKLLNRKKKKEQKKINLEIKTENGSKNDIKDPQNKPIPKNKIYSKMVDEVIRDSDVIFFALDARDPEGCRNRKLEASILAKKSDSLNGNKRVVLVLNKIDLVPVTVINDWLTYLRRELPVLAFKASTQGKSRRIGISRQNFKEGDEELSRTKLSVGVETMMSLLKNYNRSSKTGKITVGVIGYPNVGKSSIVNSLKRSKIASTSPIPGHTKELQIVKLSAKLRLVDSPGVVFADSSNYCALVLKNAQRVEKIVDPEAFIKHVLDRCPINSLREIYDLPQFTNVSEFLYLIASRRGFLSKGGIVNTDSAARSVIRDWHNGKISYYTHPPSNKNSIESTKIVPKWSESFDIEKVMKQNFDDLNVVEMRDDENIEGDNGRKFVSLRG